MDHDKYALDGQNNKRIGGRIRKKETNKWLNEIIREQVKMICKFWISFFTILRNIINHNFALVEYSSKKQNKKNIL